MRINRIKLAATAISLGFIMTACDSSDDDPVVGDAIGNELSLKVLHINDHHSHLNDSSGSLILGGIKTDVRIGGFTRVVEMFNILSNTDTPVLKLHAGDAITGDLYYTLFNGEADAAMMNEVCFDAFALGNHEFDDGDQGLANFLDYLQEGDCNTEVLAANVKPEVGVSPLAMNSATDYFKPYIVKEYDSVKVGIVGIDIASKTKNSSSPDETTNFLDETTTAQATIDTLKAEGVTRIILMTHYQYENDLRLAAALTDVDVIVGGDSHTLLGSAYNELGLNSAGEYPTQLNNLDGDPVCVVQAWQYSSVVGELNVTFDADGKVSSCTGQPHLLLADSFSREDSEGEDVELSGDVLAAVQQEIAVSPVVDIVAQNIEASAVLAAYESQVADLKAAEIGNSVDTLCLERIPGQGVSSLCDASETATQGSDIANIVALAFKTMSITSDIAIQNGGGVRTDIAAGPLSIGDAYTLLPFSNTLVELQMTGAEIKQVLEEALDYALQEDGSTGAYPYASGLRWQVDASQAMGSRFTALEVKLKEESTWRALVLDELYTVVTNNYIAGGKDGYLTFGTISAQEGRVVDTYLDYAQSFVDYVTSRDGGQIYKLDPSEYSTQSYLPAP